MEGVVGNQEKVFHQYLELPENARSMVINEMEPSDKCRFTRCSKICKKGVQTSKNYVYEVNFAYRFDGPIGIIVLYDKCEERDRQKPGFSLRFFEESGSKFREYRCLTNGLTLRTELNSSTDLSDHAIEEFRNRMMVYQFSVKSLRIHGNGLANVNLGVDSLNSLEKLDIRGNFDALQFLLKLRKPLQKLYTARTGDIPLLTSYKHIYQVKDQLICWRAKFNIEQMKRLTAKSVYMDVGRLTAKDIFTFIRSWQNGSVGKDVEIYRWCLRGYNFNKKKLLQLLRVRSGLNLSDQIEIKHYKQPGRSARLKLDTHGILVFSASHVDAVTQL